MMFRLLVIALGFLLIFMLYVVSVQEKPVHEGPAVSPVAVSPSPAPGKTGG